MTVQTCILFWGLLSLKHMKKQESIQSYTSLSNRLFQQNLEELHDPRLFESLSYEDGKYPGIDKDGMLRRKLKHYLFMQFTLYEQMFLLHRYCEDIEIMRPWCNRIFRIIRKDRVREYWEKDYIQQSCDGFKKFVTFGLDEANSAEELFNYLYKREPTFIAQYFSKLLGWANSPA